MKKLSLLIVHLILLIVLLTTCSLECTQKDNKLSNENNVYVEKNTIISAAGDFLIEKNQNSITKVNISDEEIITQDLS